MDDHIDWAETEREEALVLVGLKAGVCPSCSQSGVQRRVDPRQNGDKGPRQGMWVNYRCPCGFARDYVESPWPR